jgi:diguanylate cyclase (GGDEF)-like protein
MRISILGVSIITLWSATASAIAPAPLNTLRAIHSLSNAEADQARPVAFQATVTYLRRDYSNLFVEDDGLAIYVNNTANSVLAPGDRVLVRGTTQGSFRPIVNSQDITVLSHGIVPGPVPATFDDLIRAHLDCMRVKIRGVVVSADLEPWSIGHKVALQVRTDGGYVKAVVDSDDAGAPKALLSADVEVIGVASGQFDGKMQLTGAEINVSSLIDVKVLRAGAPPDSLTVTSMADILSGYHVRDFSERVRVRGIITYYQAGSALVLQNGTQSLWITTDTEAPLQIGSEADVTGIPDPSSGFLTLTHAEVTEGRTSNPIPPLVTNWKDLSSGKHVFDLVSLQGRLVRAVREAEQDEYVLESDGHLFSAIYSHPSTDDERQLPPINPAQPESKIQVIGICVQSNSDPFNGPAPFNILLRSSSDIAVIAGAPLLNIRNLSIAVGVLIVVVFAVGARGWFNERGALRQVAALAYVEQRRSQILEKINGSCPLAEIISQITELVSFKLKGAPCWCQINEGVRLGNCPPDLTGLRVVHQEVHGRSGLQLGAIFAAFDGLTKASSSESAALSMAGDLAKLAIETRHHYSDLLRRSDFDGLTDTHNRSSLESRLDSQIEESGMETSIFGVLYIDLDGFKQINDRFGHQIGDLYLREVVLRMKSQLRSVDTLGRVGGDEFVVLVPSVPSRGEVEEIAHRLESCFDKPFAVGDQILNGSACVGIALYPDDGDSRESLISAADAAMYAAKHAKHWSETNSATT